MNERGSWLGLVAGSFIFIFVLLRTKSYVVQNEERSPANDQLTSTVSIRARGQLTSDDLSSVQNEAQRLTSSPPAPATGPPQPRLAVGEAGRRQVGRAGM